jgi:hypothetical protein
MPEAWITQGDAIIDLSLPNNYLKNPSLLF